VLTHAHEDHIGAVAYLLDALGNPTLYATPFTAGMIRHKLKEWRVKGHVVEVPLSGTVDLAPFEVTFVSLTHSIPEPNALAIKTPYGTLLHTGDWKIDPCPLVGEKTDEKALKALGKKGVLALISDSTSVFEEGWSGSEETVQKSLIKLAHQHPDGRIIIGCFASNVARVLSCWRAAEATGRRLGLVGRSLDRIDQVARSCGYFEDIPPFLKEGEIQKIDRRKALIVSTGSQGESRAALMRMAYDQHPRVRLEPGDVVLFSSRVIPGNEKSIFALQNQLVKRGIKVVTHKEADDIHVSGHPSKDELEQMYRWVKPQKAIPVHGEDRHLHAHAALAYKWGVKESLPPQNGQVIRIAPGPLQVVGEVHVGRLALDGTRLIPTSGAVLAERSQLMASGIVQIALALSGGRLKDCQIHLMGLAEPEEKEEMILCVDHALHQVLSSLSSEERNQNSVLISLIRQTTRRVMNEILGKKPLVHVSILRV
jgi:ribonuclease J